MKKQPLVKITAIHPKDALYIYRYSVIGMVGYFIDEPEETVEGYFGGKFVFSPKPMMIADSVTGYIWDYIFLAIQVEKL
jgi:hypothetical protein